MPDPIPTHNTECEEDHNTPDDGVASWTLRIDERTVSSHIPGYGYSDCAYSSWVVWQNRGRGKIVDRIKDAMCDAPPSMVHLVLEHPTSVLACVVGDWDQDQ